MPTGVRDREKLVGPQIGEGFFDVWGQPLVVLTPAPERTAANWWALNTSIAGQPLALSVANDSLDANVDLEVHPKGTGVFGVAARLQFLAQPTSEIIPGATALILRDSTGAFENVRVEEDGDVVIRHDLRITNDAFVLGTLNVTGALNLTGGLGVGGNLNVVGSSDFQQLATAHNGLIVYSATPGIPVAQFDRDIQFLQPSTGIVPGATLFRIRNAANSTTNFTFTDAGSFFAGGNASAAGTLTAGTGLTVSSGGAAITGATTVVGTAAITGDTTITGFLVVQRAQASVGVTSTTGTNNVYVGLTNTGGTLRLGQESSVGGSLLAGTAAYDGFLDVTGARPIHVATNGVIRLTVAAAGAVSTVGAFTSGGTLTGSSNLVVATTGVFGTGAQVTAGNLVVSVGNISAGGSIGAGTSLTAGSTVTAATGLVATTGGATLTAGNLTLVAGNISFSGTSQSIVAPTTQLLITNHAGSANNVIISDAGAVTTRSTVTVTAGGLVVSAGGFAVTGTSSQGGGTLTLTSGSGTRALYVQGTITTADTPIVEIGGTTQSATGVMSTCVGGFYYAVTTKLTSALGASGSSFTLQPFIDSNGVGAVHSAGLYVRLNITNTSGGTTTDAFSLYADLPNGTAANKYAAYFNGLTYFAADIQQGASQKIGVFGTAPAVQGTVTGSRGGNAALASLLTKLAANGFVIDNSSP